MVETTQVAGSEAQPSQAVTRSKLVQRLLTGSTSLPAFVNDLVTTQAVVVAGTEAAGFLIERNQTDFNLQAVAHVRPDQSSAETRAAALSAFQEIVRPCIVQNKDGAIEITGGPDDDPTIEPRFCLVTLLRNESETVAVTAVITRCRDLERAKQRLMSMQLVAGYFDLYTLRRTSDQNRVVAQSHQHVLQLASAVATATGFNSAATSLCNELANRTGALRVSIGWLKGRRIRIKALSHTEKFDKKQELIVELERVMEECFDQEEMVKYDPDGDSTENVTREAQAFSRKFDGNIILSLPLRKGEELTGVVTLEFPREQKLSPQAAMGLAVAVDLLAPQLHDRYQNDRYLITKAGLSIQEMAKLTIGPKHTLAKLVVTLLLAAVLFVSFYSPMYNVSAPFEFAPVAKRLLAAPFDGYIADVKVQPGDTVTAGQVLLELDTTELRMEYLKAMADVRRFSQEAETYLNERKLNEFRIAEAMRDRARAEADHYQWLIDQSQIVAPMDGEVLRGDWRDKIGAQVRPSDVLFEIAQRGTLRAELFVPERDIQKLYEGQPGKLATAALPTETYPILIERIVPLSEPRDGRNVFRVHAKLDEELRSEQWRPGMMGEARVEVGRRPLIWQWTHRLIDFVRLKLWI